MQQHFDALRAFDPTDSTVHLWVFKKSSSAQKYVAKYVQTDATLAEQFKQIYRDEIARVTEHLPYGHLTDNNGISCLTIEANVTQFSHLQVQVDRPEPECRTEQAKDLKGADGYVVKFTHNDTIIYAVRRCISNWKTAYSKKFLNIVFANGELSAVEDNSFSIELNFDFFVKDGAIFIANKIGFESTLKYRDAYSTAFNTLQLDPIFSPLFTDLQPLVSYVGNNPVHLRRMAAIIQKGIFSTPNFLANLQRVSVNRNWGINFDPNTNQIVVCDITAKTIVEVFLDHRLMSEVTAHSYLVPDAILQ